MMGSIARITIGVALACSVTLGSGTASAADYKYIGANKCKTCHKKLGDQYAVWKKSGHAKAYEALMSDKAIAIAKEKGIAGPPSKAAECLKCHSTAAGLSPKDVEGKPLVDTDGVQCESCHGPGSGYKKKSVMADRDKAIAAGLVIPDAKTCTKCHNDQSPTWTSFNFDEAAKKISHPIPADVKGKSKGGSK